MTKSCKIFHSLSVKNGNHMGYEEENDFTKEIKESSSHSY